jgi:dihydroflavonol-4-reductase
LVEKRNFNKIQKKVLVTGATGHLGYNLCLTLLKKKFQVYALCRQNSNIKKLSKSRVEIINGDVMNYNDFYSAAIGKNYIIHAAAIYSHKEDLRDETLKTAIKSAKNFCKIINKLNIKKGIYVSSVSILGLEDKPTAKKKIALIKDSKDPYVKSKLNSYKIVANKIVEKKLPISIILPSSMLGKNDFRMTPSTANIKNMIKTPFGLYVDGGINIINIQDVCDSIIKILSLKKNFIHILSGHNITIRDLVKKARLASGKFIFSIKLPKSFFLMIYYFHKIFYLHFIFNLPLNIFQIKNIGKFSYFDNSKVIKNKILKITSINKTLAQCLKNF